MASSRQRKFDSWIKMGFLYPVHEVEVYNVGGDQKLIDKLLFGCPVCPKNPVVTDFKKPKLKSGKIHLDCASHLHNLNDPDAQKITASEEATLPPGRVFLKKDEKDGYLRGKMGLKPAENSGEKEDVANLQLAQLELEGRHDKLESTVDRQQLEIEEMRLRYRELCTEVKDTKDECVAEVNFNREMIGVLDQQLFETNASVECLKVRCDEIQEEMMRPLANSTELQSKKEVTINCSTGSNDDEEEEEEE